MSDSAQQLAARLRLAMETHAERVLAKEHVSGVGVAWRDGGHRFVVQTDSTENVEKLRAQLPSQVEGFALRIEVEAYPKAAVIDLPPAAGRPSLWQRLLGHRRRWLGFVGKSGNRVAVAR